MIDVHNPLNMVTDIKISDDESRVDFLINIDPIGSRFNLSELHIRYGVNDLSNETLNSIRIQFIKWYLSNGILDSINNEVYASSLNAYKIENICISADMNIVLKCYALSCHPAGQRIIKMFQSEDKYVMRYEFTNIPLFTHTSQMHCFGDIPVQSFLTIKPSIYDPTFSMQF